MAAIMKMAVFWELSFERLKVMRRYVFGLDLFSFLLLKQADKLI
jgi:hypothetical protein